MKATPQHIYIGLIAALAILLAVLPLLIWPMPMQTQAIWLVPVMVALIALAGRFPFQVSPQGDATLVTVPLFMAALLLHPSIAVLVGIAGTLISERLLRARTEVTIYNVAVNGTAAGLAGMLFFVLRPDGDMTLLALPTFFGAILAGLILGVTHLLLLFGMITIIKGREFWAQWRQTWAFEVVLDLGSGGNSRYAHIGAPA